MELLAPTPAADAAPAPLPQPAEAMMAAPIDGRRLILNAYKLLARDLAEFATKDERLRVRRAFEYSLRAHGDVRRKSGEPYILHPLAVARIVMRELGLKDTTSVVCALLHDVVEDTFVELDDIQREFGPDVALIIDGLTKIAGVFDPSSSKQAENFRKMLVTMSQDIRVVLIKLADRLHNMRTLGPTRRETQLKIAAETNFLYAPLATRLGLYNVKSELEDLALSYTEPEVYYEIQRRLAESKAQRNQYIQGFMRPVRERLLELGLQFEMKSRIKSISSIYAKMRRQGVPLEEVYDVFAVRLILESRADEEKWDCWRAYSAITSIYRPHPERTRDWISVPKATGYEALHVTVMGPKGRWVEVQIRTTRMNQQAERGLASHWRYKEGPPTPDDFSPTEAPVTAENGTGKQAVSNRTRERQRRQRQRMALAATTEQRLDAWLERVRDLLENAHLTGLDFLQEFRLDLAPEEIYVFTPKGELRILPQHATALDFAYEIHTTLGHQCIGAKVNQRVVALSHELHNGDQVEVITSRKQLPTPEWLQFVRTPKARNKIKEALKEQRKTLQQRGQEIVEWKLRNLNISAHHPVVLEVLAFLKVPSLEELYYRVGTHRVDVKEIDEFIKDREHFIAAHREAPPTTAGGQFDRFVEEKLGRDPDALVMDETMATGGYRLAPCCAPIPGDSIVGLEEPDHAGIAVHRTTCPTAVSQMSSYGQRIVKAKWTEYQDVEFLAALNIVGQDRKGMLNAIVRVLSMVLQRNIRSFTIDTTDGMFDCTVRLYVHHAEELERIREMLLKVQGVFAVNRTSSV